jgi:uncharacterized protein YbjT (DUF2867 family)
MTTNGSKDATLLLCGGTGDLGGAIARRLAPTGGRHRALLRPESDASELRALGFEIVRGDLRDADSLGPVVQGVGTVVSTVSSVRRSLMGERGLDLHAVDDEGYAALIAAAERAGVERFVYASAALPPIAMKLAPLAAAKAVTEERLRRSQLRAVIVRPDMFQEAWLSPMTKFDWPNGRLTIFGRGDTPARYIAIDDVAALMVALVDEDDPPETIDVGGPDPCTRNEAADLFERETERVMHRRHVPRAVLRAGAAMLRRPKPILATVMGLALVADLVEPTWDDEPLRARGIEPRSTAAFVRSVVRASLGPTSVQT